MILCVLFFERALNSYQYSHALFSFCKVFFSVILVKSKMPTVSENLLIKPKFYDWKSNISIEGRKSSIPGQSE